MAIHILGMVATAVGPDNFAAIMSVVDTVAEVIEKGPGEFLKQFTDSFSIADLMKQVISAGLAALTEKAIPLVIEWIGKLLGPVGAAFAFVKSIYDLLKWLWDNVGKIKAIVETVVQAFKDLLSGGAAEKVATAVESTLEKLIAPIISLIAGLAGFNGLPDALRTAFEKVKAWVQKPIQKVLDVIAKPIKGFIDAVMQRLGLKTRPLTKPKEYGQGEKKHEIWVQKNQKGQIEVVGASVLHENQKARLQHYKELAKNSKTDLDTIKHGETLIGEIEQFETEAEQGKQRGHSDLCQ